MGPKMTEKLINNNCTSIKKAIVKKTILSSERSRWNSFISQCRSLSVSWETNAKNRSPWTSKSSEIQFYSIKLRFNKYKTI
jgi:hypothetical protein